MLTNTVFNTAKGMILGNWKAGSGGEDDDDEFIFKEDLGKQVVDAGQENTRREAGWIIFEGLIHLGNQWMGTRLSAFFKLLNVSFDFFNSSLDRFFKRNVHC